MNKQVVKRMIVFSISIVVLVLIGIFVQPALIKTQPKSLVSVPDMYLFFGISALIIINSIEALYQQMPDKIGYLFLVATFIKLGFFMILFLSKGLMEHALTWSDKFGILLPLFLFLSLEVYSIATRLTDVPSEKK